MTNEWQKRFLKKLNTVKQAWSQRFDSFADKCVAPAFEEFERFALDNGMEVTTPQCDPPVRLFKFALIENGYALITFRPRGLEGVEALFEVVAPGQEKPQRDGCRTRLSDADRRWVRERFEQGLDALVSQFEAACGEKAAEPAPA